MIIMRSQILQQGGTVIVSNDPLEGQMALFGEPPAKPSKSKSAREQNPPAPSIAKQRKSSAVSGKKSAKSTSPKKRKDAQKGARSLSGLVPEGDVRLTANIREDLHLKLKIAAAQQRTTIGELIEFMVEKYIK